MAKGGKGGGSTADGRTAIKGTRGNDIIQIGVAPHIYSPEQVAKGFAIDGGAGDDFLAGGSGPDTLKGGTGNDTLIGAVDDIAGAQPGERVYDGGSGLDFLDFSGVGAGTGLYVDLAAGKLGTGQLQPGTGINMDFAFEHELQGAVAGIESVAGGAGDDYLVALHYWVGNMIKGSTLYGNEGNDYLVGRRGPDVLDGGPGDDILITGWNDDVMTGGTGNDTFYLGGRLSGQFATKTITDFETKESDADTQHDTIWLWTHWAIEWIDRGDGQPLTGQLLDRNTGENWGQVVIENLTYADHPFVPVVNLAEDLSLPSATEAALFG